MSIVVLQGGSSDIASKNDEEDFRKLRGAMEILSFTTKEQESIYRILACVLHVGNIYFSRTQVRTPWQWGVRGCMSRGGGLSQGLAPGHLRGLCVWGEGEDEGMVDLRGCKKICIRGVNGDVGWGRKDLSVVVGARCIVGELAHIIYKNIVI